MEAGASLPRTPTAQLIQPTPSLPEESFMEMSPIDPQPHPNKNACRTGDHTASRGLLRRPSPTTCIVLLGYVECMYDCSLLCPCGAPHPHSSTPNLSVELSLKLT